MDVIDLELSQMAYGGDAIGRTPAGQVVFVPFGIAGEQVRVEVADTRRGLPRARILEVLRPVPERVHPRCPHFGVCGGCHYQHIAEAAQPNMKREILQDQLTRLAGITEPVPMPALASSSMWNYRNSIQFHLTPSGRLGFQRGRSRETIDITECHLPEMPLLELWHQLAFSEETGVSRVELKLGDQEEILVVLESDSPETPEAELDLPVSLVHRSPAGDVVMAGENGLWMTVLGEAFRVSAGSFFQVNTRQAERMVQQALDWLGEPSGGDLLDLYCGVGLFSLFLAQRYERVVGVELSESACTDYALNLDRYEHVELYQAAVEHTLPHLDIQPSAAIVDPPRAGIAPAALDALTKLHPGKIMYVSCDPSTLARDARGILAAGYRLEQVVPLDMFPQTYHIESMSLFTAQ